MHGIGNDFVVLDALHGAHGEREALARALCDRRFGVGADGLIFVEHGDIAPYRMRMLNPDGSESEMCGNGLRCVAKWLVSRDIHTDALETGGRVVTVGAEGDDVAVGMGLAAVRGRLTVQGRVGLLVDVGNPHFVVFCDDPWAVDLDIVGPRLEHDPVFPDRANIHFAAVTGADEITQRTWERGAGITLACGSGATAGAAAARHEGLTGSSVRVRLPGGTLRIRFDDAGNATMIGAAELSFIGYWGA